MRTRSLLGTIFFIPALVCIHACSLWAEEDRTLRTQVREALEERFAETFVALRSEFGLHAYLPQHGGRIDGKNVILVHGLDDPGIIWQDLAPALVAQGYRVWVMDYPNDQPIRDSAVFFFKQLQAFAGREGTAPVAIIGHSMGGLMTREMATSPAIDYAKAREARLVPPLSHIVMIGTPNHGSIFSHLRFVTEIRDQMVRAGDKGYHWLRPVVDGLGEAATDIYPGSDFLTELNGRPLPRAGRMLVVAGVMSPVEQQEAVQYVRGLRESMPDFVQPPPGLEAMVEMMIDQVGDGLVSVESATLAGVPLVQVRGTHVTIIRNLGRKSNRVPPAVPIILRELAEQ